MTLTAPTPTTSTDHAPARPTTRTPARLTATHTEVRHFVPKPSGDPDPAGHLSPAQIDALAAELDGLRDEVLATRGAADAAYIRRIIAVEPV